MSSETTGRGTQSTSTSLKIVALMSRVSCNGNCCGFSAPTVLNNDLVNDDVILANYSETIKLAITGSFMLPFRRRNTPRACFLGGTMCGDDRYARIEKEMKGWDLGGRPEDLTCCPRGSTMDRTLNLMFSETPTTDKTAATI